MIHENIVDPVRESAFLIPLRGFLRREIPGVAYAGFLREKGHDGVRVLFERGGQLLFIDDQLALVRVERCGDAALGKAAPRALGLRGKSHAQPVVESAKQRVGYMAQKFSLYGLLSVRQNLEFFAGIYQLAGSVRRERIDEMIETFELERYLASSPSDLPLGYKQRLALACALMHRPAVLFLDEPTSGVDPITRREFWMHINGLVRKGVTIMVTTHFMDEAEYCDRVAMIDRARLIAVAPPDELKARAATPAVPAPTMDEAIAEAACELAADLGAAAIVTPTQTGATARQVARFHPAIHVLAATPSREVWRHLALTHGVTPALVHEAEDTDATIGLAVEAGVAHGVAMPGDLLVVTCGASVNAPGTTNLIKVERV